MTGGGYLRLADGAPKEGAPGAPQGPEAQGTGDMGDGSPGAPGGAMAPVVLTLRSTSWDGPAPGAGDVVLLGRACYVVRAVAQGPGAGQYRLDVVARPLWRWHDD
jgi:hypothetical protein